MKQPSGKFVVRLDPALHARLQVMSRERHVSLNQLCVQQIKAFAGAGTTPTLSGLSFGIPIQKFKSLLQEAGYKLQGCVVFGSAVRDNLTEKSDIDLLLVLESQEKPTRELYERWNGKVEPFLKAHVAREVSPQFAALPTDPTLVGSLWYEVSLQGTVLWEEGGTVSRFLIQLREWIASGNVLRKTSHGHPYWVKAQRSHHEE